MATRVLAVAQAATLGGAEYALLRVARRLPALGVEIELTAPGDGPLAEAARADGIRVHELPVGDLRAGSWPRAALAWPRARSLVRRFAPDAVLLNGIVSHRLAPGLGAAPVIVPHLHEPVGRAPRAWRSARFWSRVPLVLCSARSIARSAAAHGAPEHLLRVVAPPVEQPQPAPRPEWADGRQVIGFVGRIEPAKGTLDLLEAARELPDARLVIVGEPVDGAYAARVRERALALGDRVVLAGRVDDASRLMPWFGVLAVPSRVEGFGTVAAEALAAGTPVVASTAGGMGEYLGPGRGGELVPPGDARALAEALRRVLADPGAHAAAARAAAAPFAADRVAGELAAALHEAAGKR